MPADPRDLAAKRAAARKEQLARLVPRIRESNTKAEELRQQRKAAERGAADVGAMRELIHIPGFFPTPPAIVVRMIEEAELRPGMTVLEPSAGKGDIAKAARAEGATVHCCEVHSRLQTMLTRDDFTVYGCSFLDLEPSALARCIVDAGGVDRVLMNPPFERGQDVQHVQHAYKHLRPETGTLIAIMSEGPFFRDTKADREFRDWLNRVQGTAEPLPEDAFMCSERPTGVRTRLVIIDR